MYVTRSMPQWSSAPSERLPMQRPVDIQIDTQIQQALIERSVAYCQTSNQVISFDTPEITLVSSPSTQINWLQAVPHQGSAIFHHPQT